MAAPEHAAAVLVIDHDTKSSEPSRYARGSGAKLAAVDVASKIEPIRPFGKTESGTARLKVVKDRRGWLERSQEVAFIADPPADVPLTVSITAAVPDRDDDLDLSPAARKVLEALDSIPRTVKELMDRIAAVCGTPPRRPTVQKELTKLEEQGLARQAGTSTNAQLWRSTDV